MNPALLSLVILATACSGGSSDSLVGPGPLRKARFEIKPSEISFDALGSEEQLSIIATDGTGRRSQLGNIKWSSLDPLVAEVDANGHVAARGVGETQIVATGGARTAHAAVIVEQVPVFLSVKPQEDTLNVEQPIRVQVTARDANGNDIPIEHIAFKSDKPSIADVTKAGVVTARSIGSTFITVAGDLISEEGEARGKRDTVRVEVRRLLNAISVRPRRDSIFAIGATLQLIAIETDENGTIVQSGSLTWSSSDPSLASVDGNGRVTAHAEGSTTITAAAEGKSDSAVVVVIQKVTAVTVSPALDSLSVGAGVQLTAAASDANGYPVASASFLWSSRDPAVAEVDGSGFVQATGYGTTQVVVTESSGASASATIVVPPIAAFLNIQPKLDTLEAVGDSVQLSIQPTDADGNPVSCLGEVWRSLAPAVAVVSPTGRVLSRAFGVAGIVAESCGISDTARVVVADTSGTTDSGPSAGGGGPPNGTGGGTPPPLAVALNIRPKLDTLRAVGDSVQLSIQPTDANGNPMSCLSEAWRSLTPAVAEVNQSGRALSRAFGVAGIVAESCGISDTATVVVSPASGTGGGTPPPLAATLNIEPKLDTLTAVGDSVLLSIQPTDANGTPVSCPSGSWTSLAPAVAEVNPTGRVFARAFGVADIVAESCGIADTAKVVVADTSGTGESGGGTPPPPPPPPPASGSIAELPRFVIRWSEPQPTKVIRVNAGDDLQAAIDAARPGDMVEVAAGTKWGRLRLTPLRGGFATLRGEVCPVGFGSRIRQQDLAALPYVETPDNRIALDGTGASGWWVTCMGFRPSAANTAKVNDLVRLTGADSVVLDRVHITGSSTQSVKRGVAANGSRIMVIGSRIEEIHVGGQDSQTIAMWNSPAGVLRVHNNFLAAAAENILVGGAKPSSCASLPRDIEVTQNHIYKDPAWVGKGLDVKNLFEIKTAQRVLFEGNVMENEWPEAQAGYWLIVKSGEQTIPCGHTQDVTIRLNKIISVCNGANMARWSSNGKVTDLPTQRILYEQNLYEDFGDTHGQTVGVCGIPFQHLAPEDVVIRSNTTISPPGNPSGWAKADKSLASRVTLQGNLWSIKGLSNWPWATTVTASGNVWINTRDNLQIPAGTTIFPGDPIPVGVGADTGAVNAATAGVQDPNP